jgi:hypothetical protein
MAQCFSLKEKCSFHRKVLLRLILLKNILSFCPFLCSVHLTIFRQHMLSLCNISMCFHMRFCALNVLFETTDLVKTQLTHAQHRKFGTADIELTFTWIMPRYSNSNSCDICRLLYVASEMQ